MRRPEEEKPGGHKKKPRRMAPPRNSTKLSQNRESPTKALPTTEENPTQKEGKGDAAMKPTTPP
jgi:hypothetical protein